MREDRQKYFLTPHSHFKVEIMRTILIQHLELLNIELEALITELKQYSHESLNRRPNEDAWSPIQVLHHLMLSEKLSIAYCQKKLSFKPKLKKANFISKIRSFSVKLYLDSPFKFKAPKGLDSNALPTEDQLESVIDTWRQQRADLRSFIQSLPEEYLDREVYKHPFGGRLSIEGLMVFFKAHFANHRKQIRRALATEHKVS